MERGEALGIAQILLGLLLFTVGILPTLLVQLNVEEPIQRVFHKRMRTASMIGVGVFTLALVVTLVVVPADGGPFEPAAIQIIMRILTSAMTVLFVVTWFHIYTHVTVHFVVDDIVGDVMRSLEVRSAIRDADVQDLLRLGENLKGEEKECVIEAIGKICAAVQNRSKYDGTELVELLRALQRTVVRNGTLDHHRSAFTVAHENWKTLVQKNLATDQDAKVLMEVVWVLGAQALSQQMESTASRWMSLIPNTVEVQYRIGTAAALAGRYTVAIEALSRLSWIAQSEGSLPKEFIALAAQFYAGGPSAGRTALQFINRLGYSRNDICLATERAVAAFTDICDYATADAIGSFLCAVTPALPVAITQPQSTQDRETPEPRIPT